MSIKPKAIKRILSMFVVLSVLIGQIQMPTAVFGSTAQKPSGGGSQSNPYIIKTEANLRYIASETSKYYELENDIVVTGTFPTISSFTGTLDGKDYAIKGLSINGSGLFGTLNGATIKNLKLENVNVNNNGNAGALAGRTQNNAVVQNISLTEGTVTGTSKVGGLIGETDNLTMNESRLQEVTVTGTSEVGGLIGVAKNNTTINKHSAQGVTVTGTSSKVGGLIGNVDNNITINESHVQGITVTGTSEVGGLFGYVKNNPTIREYHAQGVTVTGKSSKVGGLIGNAGNNATIEKSSVQGVTITGTSEVGGLLGYVKNNATIDTTYTDINVTGTGSAIGGLIGIVDNNTIIRNAYTMGDVSGTDDVGGIIGLSAKNNPSINFTHARGNIQGNNAGGIVGRGAGNVAINNSVALNKGIHSSNENNRRRIVNGGNPKLDNNYGYENIPFTESEATLTGRDGQNINRGQIEDSNFWKDTVNFDNSIWDLSELSMDNEIFPRFYWSNHSNEPTEPPTDNVGHPIKNILLQLDESNSNNKAERRFTMSYETTMPLASATFNMRVHRTIGDTAQKKVNGELSLTITDENDIDVSNRIAHSFSEIDEYGNFTVKLTPIDDERIPVEKYFLNFTIIDEDTNTYKENCTYVYKIISVFCEVDDNSEGGDPNGIIQEGDILVLAYAADGGDIDNIVEIRVFYGHYKDVGSTDAVLDTRNLPELDLSNLKVRYYLQLDPGRSIDDLIISSTTTTRNFFHVYYKNPNDIYLGTETITDTFTIPDFQKGTLDNVMEGTNGKTANAYVDIEFSSLLKGGKITENDRLSFRLEFSYSGGNKHNVASDYSSSPRITTPAPTGTKAFNLIGHPNNNLGGGIFGKVDSDGNLLSVDNIAFSTSGGNPDDIFGGGSGGSSGGGSVMIIPGYNNDLIVEKTPYLVTDSVPYEPDESIEIEDITPTTGAILTFVNASIKKDIEVYISADDFSEITLDLTAKIGDETYSGMTYRVLGVSYAPDDGVSYTPTQYNSPQPVLPINITAKEDNTFEAGIYKITLLINVGNWAREGNIVVDYSLTTDASDLTTTGNPFEIEKIANKNVI